MYRGLHTHTERERERERERKRENAKASFYLLQIHKNGNPRALAYKNPSKITRASADTQQIIYGCIIIRGTRGGKKEKRKERKRETEQRSENDQARASKEDSAGIKMRTGTFPPPAFFFLR